MIFSKCSAQRTSALLVISALTACNAGSIAPSPSMHNTLPDAVRVAASKYNIVHSFGANPDGKQPFAALANLNGTLYGTTSYGGVATTGCGNGGCGTVFSVTPTGDEAVLHAFEGDTASARPSTDLLELNGTLYGTAGGTGLKHAIVFKVGTSGEFVVLHHFVQGTDGIGPSSGLTAVNGTLYGVTAQGGAPATICATYTCGTVYSLTASGTETVLHNFAHGTTDGCAPGGDLINVGGTLYGATSGCGAHGKGTVFSITPGGKETVLYSFGSSSPNDGDGPNGPLLYLNGALYGTTTSGGANSCGVRGGCGTIFRLTLSGAETVVYNFSASGDGTMPNGGLVDDSGTLYGTTILGGTKNAGTIFSLTLGGTETVLHSFGSGSDARYPEARLLNMSGTLYGTTYQGGAHNHGAVFSFIP